MRRCLIIANQTLGGPHVINAVLARQAREPYEFHILVPATHEHGATMWTEGQAQAHAREALQARSRASPKREFPRRVRSATRTRCSRSATCSGATV